MSCPACGGPTEPWLTAPGSEPSDPASYEIARCRSCGSGVTRGPGPPPDAYETGIYRPEPPRAPRVTQALQAAAVRVPLRALSRAGVRPGAAVLDVGAGRGRLVSELRARGYAAEGIDPAPRSELVRRGDLLEHDARDLDAVVLWHVLEHLAEPRDALERVRSWLRPGGVVLLGVPNIGSLQARVGGASWFHLDVPRHRTHFTPDGLRAAMRAAGIDPERTRHVVPEHNLHGMWFALLSRLGMSPGFPFHLVKRNARATGTDAALLALAGAPLLPVALALELAGAALRRGGTLAVIGRARAGA